ncbi:MAG TPA: hypothetical protein VEB42_13205, partial [Chitinophagaceae bacterium]|nr:hypothetical protein [Chitinophagaceae bacterium]
MKKFKLLLGFIAMATVCQAQISWGRYSHSYVEGKVKGPQLITAILAGNNAFWAIQSPSAVADVFEEDSAFIKAGHADFSLVTSFDNENAHFFVKDAGSGQYEYRVMQDGSQIISGWTPLNTVAADSVKNSSTLRDLMYVGGFKAPMGHYLVVDLRRKNESNIISTAVVCWKPIRP